MPEWVFDTVVLIDYFCGRQGAHPYFEAILTKEATETYSTISELELWQLIISIFWGQRRSNWQFAPPSPTY